ncbi:hypothetical protein [Puia dinghuensis]|uniref:Uncharacterized protein n=1 Tax=Puia dinghuensis TaxID=1792502 RepID=A0A8J2XS92_9BACT|nr:hypothetical protein [Puia dinghuensis]GGA93120.1 hypothetical protein GCM10011511_15660 [Puia dinghuensis]
MIDQTVFNRRMPPTIQDVKTYFVQKGISEPEAEGFFFMKNDNGLQVRGALYKNGSAQPGDGSAL